MGLCSKLELSWCPFRDILNWGVSLQVCCSDLLGGVRAGSLRLGTFGEVPVPAIMGLGALPAGGRVGTFGGYEQPSCEILWDCVSFSFFDGGVWGFS